jgi:hypothetical protein
MSSPFARALHLVLPSTSRPYTAQNYITCGRSLTMGIGVALLIRYLAGIPKPRLSFHIDKTNNYYFSKN